MVTLQTAPQIQQDTTFSTGKLCQASIDQSDFG